MTGELLKLQSAPTKRLLAIGFAVTLGFAAICGSALWEIAQRDFELNRMAAMNLTGSVASEIDRNIELYDLSLQGVVDGLRLPDLDKINPVMRQVVLFDRAATAKDMGAILVLDVAGDLVLDSRTLTPPKRNYADRDFFKAHVRDANVGLYVGRPQIGDDGQYLISFSRRVVKGDGSFGGVVAGSMRLSYFHDLFRKPKLGDRDSILLAHEDGTLLMRLPFDISAIGQRLATPRLFSRFGARLDGVYKATSSLDGVARLFVYRRIGGRPLLLVTGISIASVYASFWREVWLIGVLLFGLCGIVMVLTIILTRALERRSAAEQQLARLAATDGLTGLNNRRRFEEALASEWRRLARSQSSIALLMIDVDHFKAYNDEHGHPAGDMALTSIARCIALGVKRESDLCARFGGEEFAVLLPGEKVAGALRIAERIRANVLSERFRQQQMSLAGPPTISIGLAVMTPQPNRAPRDLVDAADQALYEAKDQGRDRTIAAPTAHLVRYDVPA